MSPELRHLRSFVTLSKLLHFTRAAEQLHLTQQALSNHIQQLEAAIGAQLFVRSTRHVELTEVGRAMLPSARRAIEEADKAMRAGRAAARAQPSTVRVGMIGYAPRAVIPKIARRIRESDIELTLLELAIDEQVRRVRAGELECGLGMLDDVPVPLQAEPIYRERLLAVLPLDHPLTRRERVRLHDVAQEEIVLAEPSQHEAWNRFVLSSFQRHNLEIRPAREAFSSLGTALSILERGDRCSVLSELAASMPFTNVVMRPLEPQLEWTTSIVWDPTRRFQIIEEVVAAARELAAEQSWLHTPRAAAA